MTGIHPVQGFNNLSTKKKVALAATTAVAVASAVAAYKLGKQVKVDEVNLKGAKALKEGYKKLGSTIAQKAQAGLNSVKARFAKKQPEVVETPFQA